MRNKLLKTQKHEERVKQDFANNFTSDEEDSKKGEESPFLQPEEVKRDEDLSASQDL